MIKYMFGLKLLNLSSVTLEKFSIEDKGPRLSWEGQILPETEMPLMNVEHGPFKVLRAPVEQSVGQLLQAAVPTKAVENEYNPYQ